MNKEKLNNAFSNIDSKFIMWTADPPMKKYSRIKKWIALVACVAVIIAAVPTSMYLWNTINGNIYITNRVQIDMAEQFFFGSENSANPLMNVEEERSDGITVTAQAIEILPDTYYKLQDWKKSEFRLVKMQTLSLLVGKEMVETFYYIVPVDFMTDFLSYETLVIKDMRQNSYEYSVLYNKTQKCFEAIDLILFSGWYVSTLTSDNIMAFDSNSIFDVSLWNSTEKWKMATEYERDHLDTRNKWSLVWEGCKLEETIEVITSLPSYGSDLYVHSLESVSEEGAEALEYIQPFVNGIYVPDLTHKIRLYSPEIQFECRRYVNGYPTNEKIVITNDTVEYSNQRFTNEDLQKLPDLASALKAVNDGYESGAITPPHISCMAGLELNSYGIFGWYAKTDSGVYGIVRVTWRYNNLSTPLECYLDDKYYIVEYKSDICKSIERDDLIEVLGQGNTDYVYEGEYTEKGKEILIIYT